jgi:hypothetical protein
MELTRPSSVAKKKDADLRKPPEVKPPSTAHITMMKKWRVKFDSGLPAVLKSAESSLKVGILLPALILGGQ